MSRPITLLITIILIFSAQVATANTHPGAKKSTAGKYFGSGLCQTPGYSCIKITPGQSWQSLWPDPVQRDLVQRLNRTNKHLYAGMIIAVPDNLEQTTLYDISPFPRHISKSDIKLIIVDQDKLAWGAYDRQGKLTKWGPISSGKNYCPDVNRACKTRTGIFYVFEKKDSRCKSNVFPVGEGGAKMPYCMFFYRGFALHGSHDMPGHRDSHGCVRLFIKDAKWLNQDFVELPSEKNGNLGTKIIIQKLVEN